MNALTPEELQRIRDVTGIKNLNQHVFALVPGQQWPAELADVYLANFVIQNSQYQTNPVRLDRILRIIKYLRENNKTGGEPVMFDRIITLEPVTYVAPGQYGDYSWMITQPQFKNWLFIFNDNQEQYLQYWNFRDNGILYRGACEEGGGNAVIRPYQCEDPPRAFGIPTGSNGVGYPSLTPEVRKIIDEALERLRRTLVEAPYTNVVFSSSDGQTLGTGIFRVGTDVLSYITGGLRNVVDSFNRS